MRSEVLVASDVLKGNEGKRIDKKKKGETFALRKIIKRKRKKSLACVFTYM